MGKIIEFKRPMTIDIAELTRLVYHLGIGHVSEAMIITDDDQHVIAMDIIAAIAYAVGVPYEKIVALQSSKQLHEASYEVGKLIDETLGFPFMTGPEDPNHPNYGPFVTDIATDNDDPGLSVNDLVQIIRDRQQRHFKGTLPNGKAGG